MLQVTNRFSAPMRASNISKGQIQDRPQTKSQNVNFSGNKVGKAVVSSFTGAVFAMWCCIGVSSFKQSTLKEELRPLVSTSKMMNIENNADLIKENSNLNFFPFAKSNKYLQGVIDSVNGKGTEPHKEFNVAKLLQKEELQRQADSTIQALQKQIKNLK